MGVKDNGTMYPTRIPLVELKLQVQVFYEGWMLYFIFSTMKCIHILKCKTDEHHQASAADPRQPSGTAGWLIDRLWCPEAFDKLSVLDQCWGQTVWKLSELYYCVMNQRWIHSVWFLFTVHLHLFCSSTSKKPDNTMRKTSRENCVYS